MTLFQPTWATTRKIHTKIFQRPIFGWNTGRAVLGLRRRLKLFSEKNSFQRGGAKCWVDQWWRKFWRKTILGAFAPTSFSPSFSFLSLSQSHAQTINQHFSNQRIQFSLSWFSHSAFSLSLFLKIFAFCHFLKGTVSRKLSSREKTFPGKNNFSKIDLLREFFDFKK